MVCTSAAFAQGRRGGGGGGGPGGGGAGQGGGNRGLPPAAYFGAKVVEPLQRWEYGRLDILADVPSHAGVFKVTWHGPDGEKFEAASVLELVQKLAADNIVATTAPAEIDDDLVLWNMLGDRGWDYILQEVSESPVKGKLTVIRFKRPRR